MRVELRDGQWVELRTRVSHGDAKFIRKAWIEVEQDKDDKVLDLQTIVVSKMVKDWNVRDIDDEPITWDGSISAVERMPSDIADIVYDDAAALYKAATRPNSSTPAPSDA